MKLSIIGLGFVGLTTAACFATRGFQVLGVDIDNQKIQQIITGQMPFYEAGLERIVKRSLRNHSLALSTNFDRITQSDITLLTVGTPTNEDGSVNLTHLVSAAESIGQAIADKKKFHTVVVKSTVPPGTTLEVVVPAIARTSGKRFPQDFGVCSNPEFLKEGSAIVDTLEPDKVVIGTIDNVTKTIVSTLYRRFYKQKKIPILHTNPQTAELIKYANNSFLATKVSFINMIANICQKIPGTDVETIACAIGLDKRIGPLFLRAGLGYGGSCFPKDVAAMIGLSEKLGYSPDLLKYTQQVNQLQPYKAIELLKGALPILDGHTISVLGLSFKPDTTDMREAVSLKIIKELRKIGARVKVYDPMAVDEARRILGDLVDYCKTMEECLTDSDACIVVTEWKEFKKITPLLLRKYMKNTIIVDGRRVTKPEKFIGKVEYYSAIGHGS